nr:hypothetical protein Itr_chr01CG06970 [Ipomoea trifida]GMC77901.1 hypothetical protein Iba_chr03fCG2880 [Ipomoea batatas]
MQELHLRTNFSSYNHLFRIVNKFDYSKRHNSTRTILKHMITSITQYIHKYRHKKKTKHNKSLNNKLI